MEIVGVIKDIKYESLRDEVPVQMFEPYLANIRVRGMTVYVRTAMAPEQFFAAARARVHSLDSNVPVYAMRTMDQQVADSLLIERLIASLSAVFGFLATLLAVVGLYGVMAYTVARRTREIGIRMALGAFQGDVIWMVMREVLALVAVGLVAGDSGSLGAREAGPIPALWRYRPRSAHRCTGCPRLSRGSLRRRLRPRSARQPYRRHARVALRVSLIISLRP